MSDRSYAHEMKREYHVIHVADDDNSLEVVCHDGPYDEGISLLHELGTDLITSRDLAEVRLLAAKAHPERPLDHPVTRNLTTHVAESVNYFPNGEIIVASTAYSPLLKEGVAKDAVRSRRRQIRNERFDPNREMVYLGTDVVQDLLARAELDPEKAIKSGVLLVPRRELKERIPSDSFEHEPLTRFLFRDVAQQYGHFLKGLGYLDVLVESVDETYAKKQARPFCRSLVVCDCFYGSESSISCSWNDLDRHMANVVCGIRREPEELTEQVLSEEDEAEIDGLDEIIDAIRNGTSFVHAGKMYVPLKQDALKK